MVNIIHCEGHEFDKIPYSDSRHLRGRFKCKHCGLKTSKKGVQLLTGKKSWCSDSYTTVVRESWTGDGVRSVRRWTCLWSTLSMPMVLACSTSSSAHCAITASRSTR